MKTDTSLVFSVGFYVASKIRKTKETNLGEGGATCTDDEAKSQNMIGIGFDHA